MPLLGGDPGTGKKNEEQMASIPNMESTRWTMRFILFALLPLVLLSGCSRPSPESLLETAKQAEQQAAESCRAEESGAANKAAEEAKKAAKHMQKWREERPDDRELEELALAVEEHHRRAKGHGKTSWTSTLIGVYRAAPRACQVVRQSHIALRRPITPS